jgi:hypothetical protein
MPWQPAGVIHPDAELWATGVVRAALTGRPEAYVSGVKVDNKIPNPRPNRLVQIRRDGGPEDGVFDNPRFGVNVWAASEKDVANLARLVAALFRQLPGDGVCVAMRQLSGPSSVPDAQPRRFMTFEGRLRGTPLEV